MITKDECEELRRQIKIIAEHVGALRRGGFTGIPSEAAANVTLAYRHLEDASMRLGKAIQALDGGTSVYDKKQVPLTPLEFAEEEAARRSDAGTPMPVPVQPE
jgi:hypothetical protein